VSPRAREEKKDRRSTCGSGRKVKGDEEEERKEETGFARSPARGRTALVSVTSRYFAIDLDQNPNEKRSFL